MNIKQLQYFAEVVRVGSISQAAKNLYLSQSSLTYQIQRLEQEVGVPLFLRANNRLSITPSGQVFHDAALECVNGIEQAIAHARELAADSNAVIAIGHTDIDSDPYFADYMADFYEHFPSLGLHLEFGSALDLFTMLESGDLDLLVAYRREIELGQRTKMEKLAGYSSCDLFLENEMCVLRRDYFDPMPRTIYPSDLREHKLIFPNMDIMPVDAEWFPDFPEDQIIRPKSLDLALTYASAGQGICVVAAPLTSLPASLVQVPFGSGQQTPRIVLWRDDAAKPNLEAVKQHMIGCYHKARI